MDTTRTMQKTAFALLAAGAGLFLATAVRADTLSFNAAPASNAVAEMSRRYGVSIVFRSAVNSSKPVTFSVDNPDTPDGRVQAMNDLGNALDMDFQKVFVVSKIDPGTTVPDVKVDNDGPIVFPNTRVNARDAIKAIAGVDGALTQISREIQGNVVFSSRRQTASSAAAAVAKQTGTVWHAYYGFYKRGEEPARLKGDVVDHDINGNPVMALPLVSFRNSISTPAPISGAQISGSTPTLNGPNVTSVLNTGSSFVPDFGFSPFGYGSPYGYDYGNPYASNGFGYTAPNGGVAFPGFDYTPGQGTTPVVPGMNAPGLFPPGATVTSVPSTGILPDFPFSGGGSGMIGGY